MRCWLRRRVPPLSGRYLRHLPRSFMLVALTGAGLMQGCYSDARDVFGSQGRNGRGVWRYADGSVHAAGLLVRGRKVGAWTNWYVSGDLQSVEFYTSDESLVSGQYFAPDGRLICEVVDGVGYVVDCGPGGLLYGIKEYVGGRLTGNAARFCTGTSVADSRAPLAGEFRLSQLSYRSDTAGLFRVTWDCQDGRIIAASHRIPSGSNRVYRAIGSDRLIPEFLQAVTLPVPVPVTTGYVALESVSF